MAEKKYTDYEKRILSETGVVIKQGTGPTLGELLEAQEKKKKKSVKKGGKRNE